MHIEQTIEELTQEVNGLMKVIGGLQEYQQNRRPKTDDGGQKTEKKAKAPEDWRSPKPGGGTVPKVAKRATPAGKLDRSGPELVAKARGLKEPFRAGDVLDGCNLSNLKQAQNVCTAWLKRGWISKCGHGEFNRSKSFGTTVASANWSMREQIHREIEAEKKQD